MNKSLLFGMLIGGAAVYLATSSKGKEMTEILKKEITDLKQNYPEKIDDLKFIAKEIIEQKTLKPGKGIDVLLTDNTVSKEENIDK